MAPTEPRSPVSHRKLGVFGVAALIAAGLVVGTGIRANVNYLISCQHYFFFVLNYNNRIAFISQAF